MNRMTARERRRKAKILIGTLQEQVGDLTRHNEDLRRDNALLRAQLQAVTAQNQSGQGTVAIVGSVGSSSMSTNPAEATGTIASTTATTTATASTSAGSAVSANPSPMAAPTTSACSTNHNLSDPVTAASLVLRLQQLQQQSQQQPSLASISSPQTNPAVMGSTNFQAQIDQLRQQQALRMLGLQVPAQMAMHHRPSVITTTAGIAVPTRTSTTSLPTTDLAASALSTYRQQQQQPSQGVSSLASAQIDPQLLANTASATSILQNLGLLGGTGALPNAVPRTADANVVNVNTNALVQLLPALLGQQQQDQQGPMPPMPRPNTQGQPPQK